MVHFCQWLHLYSSIWLSIKLHLLSIYIEREGERESFKFPFLSVPIYSFVYMWNIPLAMHISHNASWLEPNIQVLQLKCATAQSKSAQQNYYDLHPCYKTDFYLQSWGPQSYFRYSFPHTKWTLCASMRKKIKVRF